MSKHFDSRKQGYEQFVIDVSNARKKLLLASEPTAIAEALEETESLLTSYANDQSIKEEDFSLGGPKRMLNTIHSVRIHRFTKDMLVDGLDILINDAKKIVEKENSNFLKKFFFGF